MGDAMTTLRQSAQQALEALDKLSKLGNGNQDGNSLGNTIAQEAREHLFTALAQPAQEPVAKLFGTLPVFDTPPAAQRLWQGLTERST